MFALFFPAATGIMAGANMSGDLRDPGQVSAARHVRGHRRHGCRLPRPDRRARRQRRSRRLIADNFIMHDVAVWPSLIVAGVFAATLSSALGSMLGAPRILQAFARDGVFKALRFFGERQRGHPTSRAGRSSLTAIVSQAAIALGDLNAIAPIITMFFMVTYGTLNLACFYEGYSRNPSFRPRFRYSHWIVALAGNDRLRASSCCSWIRSGRSARWSPSARLYCGDPRHRRPGALGRRSQRRGIRARAQSVAATRSSSRFIRRTGGRSCWR